MSLKDWIKARSRPETRRRGRRAGMLTSPTYAEDVALITRTHALYCQLLDDLRFEDWGELFTEDAEWKTPFSAFRGRPAIVEGLRAMEPEVRGWIKHLSYAPVIEFEGPATARAWSDLVVFGRDRTGGVWGVAAVGRYYDRLEKEAGVWRFRSRAADIDTAYNPLANLEPVPAP
jgi:hypothetical protein